MDLTVHQNLKVIIINKFYFKRFDELASVPLLSITLYQMMSFILQFKLFWFWFYRQSKNICNYFGWWFVIIQAVTIIFYNTITSSKLSSFKIEVYFTEKKNYITIFTSHTDIFWNCCYFIGFPFNIIYSVIILKYSNLI